MRFKDHERPLNPAEEPFVFSRGANGGAASAVGSAKALAAVEPAEHGDGEPVVVHQPFPRSGDRDENRPDLAVEGAFERDVGGPVDAPAQGCRKELSCLVLRR